MRTSLERTCLGVAAAAAPFLTRVTLRLADASSLSTQDVQGLLSDLGVSLIFASLLIALIKWLRWVALPAVWIWSLLNYASFEHIRELGTALQFTFAGFVFDRTFVTGSMQSLASPALLSAILALSTLACGFLVFQRVKLPGMGRTLAGGIVFLIALSTLSSAGEGASWRQRHFVHQNIEQFRMQSPVAKNLQPVVGSAGEVFSADLSGEPRIELPQPRTNILLLVLEGIPAVALDSISAGLGIQTPTVMPLLNDRAAQGLSATNFALHQRQTNRGLYSILCGRYPKLAVSTPRMTEYAHSGGPPCLPRVLGAASYRTVFIQGAPLAFMLKDAFAERAGFDEIYGDRHIKQPAVRTNWGVDDRSLFRKTTRLIRNLEKREQPWFVSLLTAGTHHPFATLPDSAYRPSRRPGFRHAAAYLDTALAEFLDELEESGTLDHTLVVITADESRGVPLATDIPSLLTQSWGPLIMLLPSRESMTLQEPYGQSDIAISILDFLGLDTAESGFIGRSLFRRYATTRRVYFANVFHKRTGAIDSAGSVLWCNARGDECSKFAAKPGALFVPTDQEQIASSGELAELQYVIQRTLGEDETEGRNQSILLIGDQQVTLVPKSDRQSILHGQNLYVPEGSRIAITIDCKVEAGEPPEDRPRGRERGRGRRGSPLRSDWGRGRTSLDFSLLRKFKPFYSTRATRLSAGDRFSLRVEYQTLEAIPNMKSRLYAYETSTKGLRLRFDTAILEITPIPEGEMPEKSGLLGKPVRRIVHAKKKPERAKKPSRPVERQRKSPTRRRAR